MQITSTTSPAAVASALPAASSASAEPGAFAQLLSAQQPTARADARSHAKADAPHEPTQARATDEPAQDTPGAPRHAPPSDRRSASHGVARDVHAARAARHAMHDAASAAPTTGTTTGPMTETVPGADAATDDEDMPASAAPAGAEPLPIGAQPPWAAHAATPATCGSEPLADTGGSETAIAASNLASDTGRAKPGGPARAALPASSDEVKAQARGASAPGITAAAEAEQNAARADAPGLRLASLSHEATAQTDSRTEPGGTLETFSLAGAAGLQGAPRSETLPSLAAPATVEIPTPATASPEFRQALGVQVSVLARDGVQRAELHLNPADMGPISVQIALEGSRAQVDFGADSPATRSLIESGLPELAAALRDAGFTLSGGGVSQHSRGDRQGEAAPGGPTGTRGAADTGEAAPRRAAIRVAQGAVDLYA